MLHLSHLVFQNRHRRSKGDWGEFFQSAFRTSENSRLPDGRDEGLHWSAGSVRAFQPCRLEVWFGCSGTQRLIVNSFFSLQSLVH